MEGAGKAREEIQEIQKINKKIDLFVLANKVWWKNQFKDLFF